MLNLVPRQESDVVLADLATASRIHTHPRSKSSNREPMFEQQACTVDHNGIRCAQDSHVAGLAAFNPGNDRVGRMR